MLDKKIQGIEYDASGRFTGVRCEEGVYKGKLVIGDPSYFPNRVRIMGQVIRAICFLRGPIPNTSGADSVQIIIPQRQVKRKYDIYIACTSSSHNVCPKGVYLAFISTIVETEFPMDEIKPALDLLGSVVFEQ